MKDFKTVMNYVLELLSIEIPLFGHQLSIMSVFIGLSILSIALTFVVKVFGGGK